jgi:hypothetical protein
MRTITLKYIGSCYQCGTRLPVGTIASQYRRGQIYGRACHTRTTRRPVSSPVPGVVARPVVTTPFTQLVQTAQNMAVDSSVFDLNVRSYIGSRLGLKLGFLGHVIPDDDAHLRGRVQRFGSQKVISMLSEIKHQLTELTATGPWDCVAVLRDVTVLRSWVRLRYLSSHRSRPVQAWPVEGVVPEPANGGYRTGGS